MELPKFFNETYLNTSLNAFEKVLNLTDWAPFGSQVQKGGSQVRLSLGVVLVVTSVATAAISLVVGLIKKDLAGTCKELAKRSLTYTAHGFLNLARYNFSSGGWTSLLVIYDLARNEFLAYSNVIQGYDLTSYLFSWIKDLKYSEFYPNLLERLSRFAS